jgi:hypothetical protein
MRRPAPVSVRRIAALVALATLAGPACFIEVPERSSLRQGAVGDALAGAVPSTDANGEPGADARVGTGPPVHAADGRVDPMGPPGPPDAAPEPEPDRGLVEPGGADFGLPPAPRPPRVTLRLLRGAHPLGCGPHDVGLAWETADVVACVLTNSRPGAVPEPIDALPGGQKEVPAVSGRVTFRIDCTGDDGRTAHDEVEVRPLTNLGATLTLPNRVQIRAEQTSCAREHDQAVLPDDDGNGFVEDTEPSAAQICLCAGYTVVEAGSKTTKCYAHPEDKVIGHWSAADDDWRIVEAAPGDRCFENLTCSGPVEYCDERY